MSDTFEATPLFPGTVLGMLGGGQLGRMFTVEALRMGYHVWVLDPDPNSPAGLIATRQIQAGYDDEAALAEMSQCAAVTIEFENIPLSSLRFIESKTRLSPASSCVEIAQDRLREKQFANQHDIATARFALISDVADIEAAIQVTGLPAILKTNRLGYDGKGQEVCQSAKEVEKAFLGLGSVECVLEQRIDLKTEVSVVLARSAAGDIHCYPVAENRHENGILDITTVPASLSPELSKQAIDMASRLADSMNYVGVLAVEFFITQDADVLVNEMAPRPHNSGHFSLDACHCSQFEQQVRMLCGLNAGDSSLVSPVAMLNLLGDRWLPEPPDWESVLQNSHSHLHLYAKTEARHGRKMGHINTLHSDLEQAVAAVLQLKDKL